MKVFTFGNITKHYWYPVLLSISCYCQFLSQEIYLSVKDIKQINSRKFFMNSIDIFSLITCGILALLSNKSSKSTFERKQRFNFKIILHFLGIITLTCTQIIIANILIVYESPKMQMLYDQEIQKRHPIMDNVKDFHWFPNSNIIIAVSERKVGNKLAESKLNFIEIPSMLVEHIILLIMNNFNLL